MSAGIMLSVNCRLILQEICRTGVFVCADGAHIHRTETP